MSQYIRAFELAIKAHDNELTTHEQEEINQLSIKKPQVYKYFRDFSNPEWLAKELKLIDEGNIDAAWERLQQMGNSDT